MGSSDKEFEKKENTNPTFIIDASALYPVLLRLKDSAIARLLNQVRVLDLTKYEIGNAARYDKTLQNATKAMELWGELLESIEEEQISSLAEVQKIAMKQSITFYDAAYVHVAMTLGMKLVTMDKEMLQKFGELSMGLNDFEVINRKLGKT